MAGIHEDIAKAVPTPRGLRCTHCGKQEAVGVRRFASHMENGWPKCCGYTMRLLTVNDDE